MYVTAKQVCGRYDNVTDVCLWRWIRDDRLGFPIPTYINGRRYWSVADLDAFDRRRIDELKQVIACGEGLDSSGWRAWELKQVIVELTGEISRLDAIGDHAL